MKNERPNGPSQQPSTNSLCGLYWANISLVYPSSLF